MLQVLNGVMINISTMS